jgi:hypothetical protein
LTLKGETNEVGTYECRWNNSKGETRHRQFAVNVNFFDEAENGINFIIISVTATIIGLLLIGMGISIKFNLDKVKYPLKRQNADQFAIFKLNFYKEK